MRDVAGGIQFDYELHLYEGHTFEPFKKDPLNQEWWPAEDAPATVVKSNPGFAPAVEGPAYAINSEKIENRHFTKRFLSPFGLLRNGSSNRHTGIDLAPDWQHRPTIALVNGVIWARSPGTEKDPSFGRIMFIKGTGANSDKLYFLAHLHEFIEGKGVDDFVRPGDEVAITGTTGSSTGIHLHLEVFVNVTDEEKEKVLNISNIAGIRTDNTGRKFWEWWASGFDYANRRRDPFNHNRRLVNNQIVEGE